MPSREVVWVKWLDICTQDGWTDSKNLEPAECESVGFLLRSEKTGAIVLSHTYSDDEVNGMICIPASVILEKRVLYETLS